MNSEHDCFKYPCINIPRIWTFYGGWWLMWLGARTQTPCQNLWSIYLARVLLCASIKVPWMPKNVRTCSRCWVMREFRLWKTVAGACGLTSVELNYILGMNQEFMRSIMSSQDYQPAVTFVVLAWSSECCDESGWHNRKRRSILIYMQLRARPLSIKQEQRIDSKRDHTEKGGKFCSEGQKVPNSRQYKPPRLIAYNENLI